VLRAGPKAGTDFRNKIAVGPCFLGRQISIILGIYNTVSLLGWVHTWI